MTLWAKTCMSLRERGLAATCGRIAAYPARRLKRAMARRRDQERWEKILSKPDMEERFTSIFSSGAWGDKESASGFGSNLASTATLRATLPSLCREHQVSTLLDIPCGDFHWMKEVVNDLGVRYIGGDIVRPLIERNQQQFGRENVSFMHIDITATRLPHADLLLCRDCLFHLSFADTLRALRNIYDADISYLLTSTHRNDGAIVNRDIVSGDFRLIDLFQPPYSFPPTTLCRINDWTDPEPPKLLCLWRREGIAAALQSFHVAINEPRGADS